MNGKTLTLAAVAASLLIGTTAGGAFAQDRGERRGGPGRGGPEVMFVQMLQQYDTNKDGKISKDEATAASTALFAAADADKDGVLTPGEMRQHREAMREERKAAMEAMRAERQAEREAAKADAPPPPGGAPQEQAMNGDGPGRDGRGHDGKGHDGKRHGWHNERADRGEDRGGRDGMRGEGRMMRVADTDENGQISQAEATAMADKMFTRMDRNKDGVISADDMPKRPVMFR
ncbi:putative membrane protein [Peteryoungia aggregata LMG 23059]|uniref:Membrane protein n=1 Tax=Peteryoungia aggregata LMG 23059 TaxID=1368425 RepID=A0ABU0G531_9HYPH|nr:EF-hand domain-containing protein [Peteryoungia aggregata]MDQ0420039.1 putative membrane protein [Peteryoungia aggregata LMG 23059]